MNKESKTGLEVAVIGMAGQFPGAKNVSEYWENLIKGNESISFFSDDELDNSGVNARLYNSPHYIRAKGIIETAEYFDGEFFNYSEIEAKVMDPQIRILHECAYEALEDSGYNPFEYKGLIGFYAGSLANHQWEKKAVVYASELSEQFETLHLIDKDFMNSRISHKLNLKGPSVSISTACSTSLTAVHMACRSLMTGECHIALAGGSTLMLPTKSGYVYMEDRIFSRDGHCRVFDKNSSGTVPGEGAGVVVLKMLERAIEDGDHIYAVVKGSAINSDGSEKVGYTAPNVEGPASAIRRALLFSRVEPESVSYIETHGTGTFLGDQIELESLKMGYRQNSEQPCLIGSNKPNIGYMGPASGIGAFIKTVLSLYHKTLPPTINHEDPMDSVNSQSSPFRVNTELRDWGGSEEPLRAGVNNIAVGGTNAHVILEEFSSESNIGKLRDYSLLLLSARSSEALSHLLQKYIFYFQERPDIDLEDVAFTLQTGRKNFPYRKAIISKDTAGAIEQLSSAIPRMEGFCNNDGRIPEVSFIFESYNLSSPGVYRELYEKESLFKMELNAAISSLKAVESENLLEYLFSSNHGNSETENLNKNGISFRAMQCIVLSYSLAKTLVRVGIVPASLQGHGPCGELVCALIGGIMTVEDLWDLLLSDSKSMKNILQTLALQKASIPVMINGGKVKISEQNATSPSFWQSRVQELHQSDHYANTFREGDISSKSGEIGIVFGMEPPAAIQDNPYDIYLIPSQDQGEGHEQFFWEGIARMWISGLDLDWDAMYPPGSRKRTPLPTYPFERKKLEI